MGNKSGRRIFETEETVWRQEVARRWSSQLCDFLATGRKGMSIERYPFVVACPMTPTLDSDETDRRCG